jgi:PAS domain S-box-containing protein
MSWDLFMHHYQEMLSKTRQKFETEKINQHLKKFDCTVDPNVFTNKTYDALVLTDAQQQILWVNEGFTCMTGYSKEFTIGQKPSFLQGENTSAKTRQKIKKCLVEGQPVRESIVNYRKDQSEYHCEIEIHRIQNQNGEVKAFLALERKLIH